MANIWNILGLDGPTSDERAIKKAYAKALKSTRPDDDPAGFMALRDAFEQAKFHAQYTREDALYQNHQDNDIIRDFEALETAPSPQPVEFTAPDPIHTEPQFPDPELRPAQTEFAPQAAYSEATGAAIPSDADPAPPPNEALALLDDINALLNDPKRRSDSKLWTAVLSRRKDLNIDDYTDFDHTFREGLLGFFGAFETDKDRYNRNQSPRIISPFVGTAIFTEMGWHDTDRMPHHIKEQVDWLWHDLDVMNVHKRPKTEVGVTPKRFVDEQTAVNPWTVFWILFALIGLARALQALNL